MSKGSKMATIGSIGQFNPHEEDVGSYLLRLKHYFKANGIKEENKVSVLITVLGPKTLSVLSDILSPANVDSKTYDELANVLENHFSPKRLVVAERYRFYSRVQRQTESISEYMVAIKHLASTCNFGSFLKDALRDKLISGIHDDAIRQKLLSDEQDLDKTFSLALMLEQAKEQTSLFGNQTNVHEIAKINVGKTQWSKNRFQGKSKPTFKQAGVSMSQKCFRCDSGVHLANDCPYKSYKCNLCKKVGHLSKVCRSRGKTNTNSKTSKPYKVHQMAEDEDALIKEVDNLQLYNIGLNDCKSGYKVRLEVENVEVDMELDTGSALTVCPMDLYELYFSNHELISSNVKLLTYSGDEVKVMGTVHVKVKYNDQSFKLPLVIVDIVKENQPMLLGRNWLAKIKLDWNSIFSGVVQSREGCLKKPNGTNFNITQHNLTVTENEVSMPKEVVALKNKYSAVFKGKIGTIKNVQAQIVLKDNAVPKFCKFRPVPFALRKQVEEELDRMVTDGIAYPVTSSEWATPLVVVPKPKGVRLCGDFKVTLNQVIQSEHYPLPQPEDIFASLAGSTFFSVVDLQAAYQQLVIAESSQPLLTLTTHKGLFRLRRLPFGLSSAPALFQAAIDEIIKNLPGTVAYLDDVLIGGSTYQEAVTRLEQVLQRFAEHGVKVNESKCKFLKPKVEYLGYRLSAEGISPQEGTIAAIRDAPEPTNKDELRSYVGLINYYGRFICNLSDKLSCFYDLLKKDVPWKWSRKCSETFSQSKNWVIGSDVLVHYDVNKPLVLTCDASPRGVGAVLSHLINGEERPIAFASKSLSSSERNYSQLHREALALVFGAKKFHKYIYGRKNVILQTDHKPLVTIFGSKKGIPSLAAARLQRWALILSAYDFDVRYRKGSEVPHADALSRLPLPVEESLELEANYVSHVEECLQVFNCSEVVSEHKPLTSLDIAKFTDRDPILSKVRDFVWHGWRNTDDQDLLPFLRRKDELSVDNNCLLWGTRVVIPDKLREQVLRLLHDQHPGITRMKLLSRSYVWWPGIEKGIENTVSSCHICQCTQKSAPKVPLQQWPRVSGRWQRIHIDFAEDPSSKQQMLVLVDSFSKWIEVFIMKSTTTVKIIERLRTLFASYGLPDELVSDNAACFTCSEFKEFLNKNRVKFTLTPPYHPASNGAAERCVQEVKKNLLRQVLGEHNACSISLQHKLDNFLFVYRNTPNTVTGLTPAEMFLNWKPKTKLSLLKPNLQSEINAKLDKQKEASDRRRGSSRYFEEGEKVYVKTVRQEKISWVLGKVLEKKSPVIYMVAVLGKIRRCHADHLRSVKKELEEEEKEVQPVESSSSQSETVVKLRRSVRAVRKPERLTFS